MDKKQHRVHGIFFQEVRVKALIVLLTLAVCALMAEFGLRAAGRLPSNTTEGFFDQHGQAYKLKKNLTKTISIPSYSYTLHTNSFGFRDEKPGVRTIGPNPYFVFLGDSMTFANGVDYQDSFVGVFARLAAAHDTDIINMGIGGYHLHEQQSSFREFMSTVDTPPAKAILCFSPISIDGFDRSHSDILVKRGYLFQRSGWRLAFVRVMLGDASTFFCFLRDNIRKIQADLTDNRLLFAHMHLDFYRKDHRLTLPENAVRFEEILGEFDDFMRSLNVAPVYVYLPASPDLKLNDFLSQTNDDPADYDFLLLYRLLETYCRRNNIQLINLLPALKERYDAGEPLNFMLDAHYNARANEIIGKTLYNELFGIQAELHPLELHPSK